jgi:hypothetical protein
MSQLCTDELIALPLRVDIPQRMKLSLDEIAQKYPALASKGWGEQELICFVNTGLLESDMKDDESLLILEESLLKLMDYHDEALKAKIVDLNELYKRSRECGVERESESGGV